MNIFCSEPGCREQPKLHVFEFYKDGKYSMDVCKEHEIWALRILKEHTDLIKKGDKEDA